MQTTRTDPGSCLLDRLKNVESLLQSVGPVLTLQAVFPDADPSTPGYVVCTPNHLVSPATPLASSPCTLHILHTHDTTRRPTSPPSNPHPTAPTPTPTPSYSPPAWSPPPWHTLSQASAPPTVQRQNRELNVEEFLEELDDDVEEVAAGHTTRRQLTAAVPVKPSSFANRDAVLDLLRCVKPGLLAPVARRRSSPKPESGSSRGSSPDTFTQVIRSRHLEDVTGSLFGSGWSHPNLAGVSMALWHAPSSAMYVVSEYLPLNLGDVLRFCKAALEDEHKVRFIVYQLLQGIQALHSQGYVHGGISLQSVLLSPQCWLKLQGPMSALSHQPSLPRSPAFPGLHTIEERWRHRLITNFEYLLWLNYLAGRRWGDVSFHYILPWVLDLTALSHITEPLQPSAFDQPDFPGWRDLSISKYRLCKGDMQLDFTYQSSETPHHISSEPLSELSYCIYHARCIPKAMLTRYVRAVFQPHEYPRSIQALYESTPDESIPEFFFEHGIFTSAHAEMEDLEVPAWAGTLENFVALNRAALESEHVSIHLHLWIDLMFGYKLSGSAAIEAKNVYLQHDDPAVLRSRGVFQLFSTPHPARKSFRQGATSRAPFGEALQEMDNLLKSVSCTAETDPPLAQPPRPPVPGPPFPLSFPSHMSAQTHHPAVSTTLPAWPAAMHDSASRSLHGALLRLDENEDATLKIPPPNGLAAGIPLAFDSVEDPGTQTKATIANGTIKEQEWIIPALRSSQQEHILRSLGFGPGWSPDMPRTDSWGPWSCEALPDSSPSLQQLMQRDVQAVGRIMLQLYLKRPCFGPQDDSAYWFRLASPLPSCVRPFVLACLHGTMTAEDLLHSTFFSPSMTTAYECLAGVLFVPVYSTDPNSPLTAAEQQLMVCLDNLVVRVRSGQLDELKQQPQVLELCLPHMLQLIHDCMKLALSPSTSQQTGLDVLGLLLAITKTLSPKSALQYLPPLLKQVLSKDHFQGFDWRAIMCAPALQLQLVESMGLGPYLESVLPLLLSVILEPSSSSSSSFCTSSSVPHRLTSATSQAAIAALTTISARMPFPVLKNCLLLPLLSVLPDSTDAALALVALAHVVGGPLCAQHLVPHLLPNLTLQKNHQDDHNINQDANTRAVDASLLILESIAHMLPMDCILNSLLEYRSASAGLSSSREFVPPPLMSPPTICSLVMVLLQPQDHFVSSTHLQRLAALLLNTAHSAGGSLLIRSYVLPQLLPLLNCSAARRAAYNRPNNSHPALSSHNSDYDPNSPLRRDTWTRRDSCSNKIIPAGTVSSTNSIMLVDEEEVGNNINAVRTTLGDAHGVETMSEPNSPVVAESGEGEEPELVSSASCPPEMSNRRGEEDVISTTVDGPQKLGKLKQSDDDGGEDLLLNSMETGASDTGTISDLLLPGDDPQSGQDSEDEAGWLELCQVVYPMLADSVGLMVLRSQVPGCQDLESQLKSRFGWQPAMDGNGTSQDPNMKPDTTHTAWNSTSKDKDSKESSGTILAGLRGRLSDFVNRAAPIPFFAQQQVLVESTFRFMDGIGWSAPSAPAVFPGSPIADKGVRRVSSDAQPAGKAGGAGKMSLIQKLTLGGSSGRAAADGGDRGEQELVSMSSQPLSPPPGPPQQMNDPLSPTAMSSPNEGLSSRPLGRDSNHDSPGQQQSTVSSMGPSSAGGELRWTGNLRSSGAGNLSTTGRDWQWLPPEQPQHRTGRMRFPWRRVPPGTIWWPQVWNLQAAALHSFTAHKGGMCALTVDPGEQWVLTAGRGPANNIPDAHVVRCWAIGDCHTEAQYTAHQAHIVSMCLLTQQPNIVASLDQLGYIHVWGRENAKQLSVFAPVIGAEAGMNSGSPLLDARVPLNHLNEVLYPQGVLLALEQRGRGWQALGGLPTGKQMAEAPEAGHPPASGTGSVSSPTSPLVRLGYTTLCPSFQRHNMLLAGSADARLCCLDVETGNIHSEMLARPSLKIDATLFISATCGNEAGWVGVGNTAGHVLVMDERCGTVQHAWKGHEGGVNTLITPSHHTILTSGQDRDKTVRLWDIRCASSSSVLSSPAAMAPESSPSSGLATSPKGRGGSAVVPGALSWQPGPCKGAPQVLQVYAGHKDAVEGMVQYKDSVITWSGTYLGLLSLSAPYPPHIQPTKVKGLKGMRDGGSIVGVGVLPFSKLLMVGTDDGTLKYCS